MRKKRNPMFPAPIHLVHGGGKSDGPCETPTWLAIQTARLMLAAMLADVSRDSAAPSLLAFPQNLVPQDLACPPLLPFACGEKTCRSNG